MRALAAVALTSCSFASVRGPEPPPKPPGDCTTASSAPSLDMLGVGVGVLGMVIGGIAVSNAQSCSALHPPGMNSEQCLGEAGVGVITFVPSAVLAIVYGVSAVYGRNAISRCRERLSGPPPPSPPPPPPPPGSIPEKWFCTESASEGSCKPSLELCQVYRSHSHHELSECVERTSATCFELGTELHCAPTGEICETLRAAAEHAGVGAVSACAVRDTAAFTPPVDR
jgi:hypothetical protein